MTELEQARRIINATDEEMAKLFQQRMDAVRTVAKHKMEQGLPIEDLTREEQLISRNISFIDEEDYRSYYVEFLKNTIEISKKFQRKLFDGVRVAYSGVEGAFANIVAERIFPDASCLGYSDFDTAYKAVEKGECDFVLLPIENSFNGDVGKVLDLAFFGSLHINGVYEAEIVQNLLGVKGAVIEDITHVISHPQALGQCAPYIAKHGFQQIESVNTAVAAKTVAKKGDKTFAAIASQEAAEKFGLVKLEGHINENSNNTTRFGVFSRMRREPMANDNRFIMLFTVKNVAGSLGKAVSVIGEHGFNLRALKSRPTKDLVWDYYFYAEGEGNIASYEGRKMLSELESCCNSVRIIASYEKEQKV